MERFDPDSITNDVLIDELKMLAKKLGKTPSRNDMVALGTDITKRLYLYGRRFGGLQEACEKAGLVPNKGNRDLKYTDEELLDHILKLQKSLNRTPTQEDIQKAGKYAIGAYKRHFCTYNNALKKIGIRHNTKFGQSVEEIKQDILLVAKLLNRTPTSREFDKYSKTVSWITASNKIVKTNSWNAVLKSCGLDIVYNKNLTEQEMKDEIIRLQNLLGRIPGYYDMIQLGKYSPEAYAYNYGTYVKALNYFGFEYTPQSQWHNQVFTKGKDGTMYRSKFEALIADILYDTKMKGDILSYEYEKLVCKDRKWTCDFYIKINDKELWIEADGMGKNRAEVYNDEHEKIKYYIDNNKNFYIINYSKNSLTEEISDLVGRNK